MSNVYTRNRKPTGLEYFDKATEIYIALRRVTSNPNIFPKRSLYTDVVPILRLFDEMRMWIYKAQTRFPTDEENLRIRKEYIQRAIEAGEALHGRIQDTVWVIDSVTPDRVEQIGILLQQELGLLRGWKRNSKIQKNRK